MRGQKITPEQIERIKAIYAETGNISEAARAAGVRPATARKYVRQDDEFDKVRQEKRADIIEQIAAARLLYVEHLMKPEVIADADAKDAATVFGILTDKHQLLIGGATNRTETVQGETVRGMLTQRLDELALRRAAKVSATG